MIRPMIQGMISGLIRKLWFDKLWFDKLWFDKLWFYQAFR
ncbi:unnamed protein product [Acidithrix sp. C25]|nr:unnamed protein product [Acidithrix sp. C25]